MLQHPFFQTVPPEIAVLPERWQQMYLLSPLHVSRQQVREMSGGIVTVGTLANRDCKGTGPAERRRFGNKVFYPREAAILWLAREIKEIPCQDSARETTW